MPAGAEQMALSAEDSLPDLYFSGGQASSPKLHAALVSRLQKYLGVLQFSHFTTRVCPQCPRAAFLAGPHGPFNRSATELRQQYRYRSKILPI